MRLSMEKIPRMLAFASVCPGCGSAGFLHKGGKHYCQDCGLVIQESGWEEIREFAETSRSTLI